MAREYALQTFRRESELRIDYAAELNEQQYAAVTAPPGPSLVLAGAGSGKTRTLTYRVAWLLEHGIAPDRVLLLTFTNKAAREMMRRVADLLGDELAQLWGGTFHSIGARILRSNAERLGFRSDFTILDREDSEHLLKACLGTAGLDSKGSMFPKPEALLDILSRAANERQPIAHILARRHASLADFGTEIERVGTLYTERKLASNVVDFDDLLVLWLRLLEQHDDLRERYRRRFQFVLVDEYQDTNRIQSDLIDLLASEHRHLMAVGDDSQSIYSWRGADFRNILEFPNRYPDARVFKIETNYRSTPEILAVANAAIAANTRQFAKQLAAARCSGPKPAVVPCEDTHQQAAFVAQRICDLHEEGVPLPEIAVLYRSHFHSLELQLEFTRRRIPFVITSGIRFFEQAHIKDVSAWLKLVANPADELAFKRVVLLFPGVGPKAAEKLWQTFSRARSQTVPPPGTPSAPVAPTLIAIRDGVPKKAATAWANFATTISQLETPPAAGHPGNMIQVVVEAFYEDYAGATFENVTRRLDDLDQLASYSCQFESITDFLTQLSLLSNLEAEAEQRTANAEEDRVRLSTVHQAKGLEFRVVFVVMLSEGLFPSARSLEDPDAAEEERRLFYVAVTRAKDELYLSHPLIRAMPGQGAAFLSKSRFLAEIPGPMVEEWNLRPAAAAWERGHASVPGDHDDDDTQEPPNDGQEPF